jgi:transcriptional regulator NrdR family protein
MRKTIKDIVVSRKCFDGFRFKSGVSPLKNLGRICSKKRVGTKRLAEAVWDIIRDVKNNTYNETKTEDLKQVAIDFIRLIRYKTVPDTYKEFLKFLKQQSNHKIIKEIINEAVHERE